jgi:hypothetical protein
MNVSGNGVGVGVGAGVGVAVGAELGLGVGAIVGGGEVAGSAGFGPGQAARRNAKIAAGQTRIPDCRGESMRMKHRYLVCQAIAVNTIQIALRAIIGIAGIGFFFAA